MDHIRPATLADVARNAEVSVATASRVLNGSTHRVSDQLADKVRHIAGELSYAPNVQAQGLARNTSSVIVVLVRDIADPYCGQIAHGVFAEAARRDARVVIAETGLHPDEENAQLCALRGFRPKSVIVVGSRTTHDESEARLSATLDQLRGVGTTIVSIGQPGLPGTCLYPASRAGAAAVARHFVELGHERVAVVAGSDDHRAVIERCEGFRSGLPSHVEPVVLSAEFTRDGGYAAGRLFTAIGVDRPTAVFVSNDVMAAGFCTAVREANLTVGDDVSVAGFGDIPIAVDLSPALTTVRLPLTQMGIRAVELAVGGSGAAVMDVDAELVIRDSTGRAPD